MSISSVDDADDKRIVENIGSIEDNSVSAHVYIYRQGNTTMDLAFYHAEHGSIVLSIIFPLLLVCKNK
jgi:hypothetical protein